MSQRESIDARKEQVDWETVFGFYGTMQDDVKKLNFPVNVIDSVDPDDLKAKWSGIRKIIRSIPSYDECRTAMEKAGCKLTVQDIGKDEKLFADCIEFSPYMRHRLTLLRLKNMII